MTAQTQPTGQDGFLESFFRDLRYAGRRLHNNWGFTTLAVLTLALGIGATTAVFSVVNGVLLQPLPYPQSGQIVKLAERTKSGGEMHVANPNFVDMRDQSHSFDGVAFYGAWPTTILGGTEPILATRAQVSTDFFSVFRVKPLMGRTFTRDETQAGGSPTAVVSFDYWRNHLGGASNFSDRSLTIEGATYPIVGVMPQGFNFPDATDVWSATPIDLGPTRTAHNLQVVARLRAGVTIEHARTDLGLIYARLKGQYGAGMDAHGFTVRSLHDELVGSVQRPLLLLLGAAALVLLVACTNVASTLLAAGAARRGEMAIRASLGAKRARVLRQLTTEGLLLAMLGAAVGLALAAFVLKLMLALAPDGALPQVGKVGLDGRVVAFAIVVGVLAAVLSSLFPALRTSQASISHDLVTRGDIGGRSRVWSALVATEVAMALLLLVGCGLLVRSFAKVISIDPGFRSAGVLTASLALPETTYPDDNSIARFYQQLLQDVGKVPGVLQVGITNNVPLTDQGYNGGFEIEGAPPPTSYTNYGLATSGYFRALNIPVKRGRLFDDRDRAGVADVALVNQAFADQYFPGVDAVGRRVRNLANDSNRYSSDRWITIVGVVGNVRDASLTAPTPATIYVNPYQRPYRARYASLVLRSSLPPQALIATLGSLLKQRGVPAKFQTMEAILSGSVAGRRFSTSVLSFFAAVALVLAAIGIYGVVSYQVVQRTREIGIRMALGAQPGQVRSLIVRNSMRIVGLGLIVGVLATPLLTRALQTLLFGISPTDPGTFVIVLLVFSVVAMLASLIPANRATRVDPMRALRSE
ncbi:MAG TPA: ABC transporter permease [Gemmatimonadaceae bacterium]